MFNQEKRRIKVIEKTLPAVVSITVVKKLKEIEKESPEIAFPLTERDDRIRKSLLKKTDGPNLNVGGGSGFIVSPKGIVITNMHVIFEGQFDYEVVTNDSKKHSAKLIGTDVINDIAFLKIQSGDNFPCLKLGDSCRTKLGQEVLAMGNALGVFRNTVSRGIVSGLSRSIKADNDYISENLKGLIQTDAAINPGNSGGPLVNIRGEVIGINSASVFQAENISFAIPINIVKEDLKKIISAGSLKKPFLGIRYINLSKEVASLLNLKEESGALIKSPTENQGAIIKGGPAEKSGVNEGDIIKEINGEKISKENPIDKVIAKHKDGDRLRLTVLRKGKILNKELVLEEK